MKTFKSLLWFIVPFCGVSVLASSFSLIPILTNSPVCAYGLDDLRFLMAICGGRIIFNAFCTPLVLFFLLAIILCIGSFFVNKYAKKPVFRRLFFISAFVISTLFFYIAVCTPFADLVGIPAGGDYATRTLLLMVEPIDEIFIIWLIAHAHLFLISMLVGIVTCFVIWLIDKFICKFNVKR